MRTLPRSWPRSDQTRWPGVVGHRSQVNAYRLAGDPRRMHVGRHGPTQFTKLSVTGPGPATNAPDWRLRLVHGMRNRNIHGVGAADLDYAERARHLPQLPAIAPDGPQPPRYW